jgi:excisionase family DNA binding protein
MATQTGGMTHEELLELPAIVDLETAGRAFGIGLRTAYTLVQRGEFPVRTLRVGRQYRIRRTDLLKAVLAGGEPDGRPAA